METKSVEAHYHQTLTGTAVPYESLRWKENPQLEAGFVATKEAIETSVIPRVKSKQHLFELGPGPATWTKVLLHHLSLKTADLVDISADMLNQAKQALAETKTPHITYTVSDILAFEPQRHYDFFFSSRMIEYVPDKKPVVAKIMTSLEVGGFGAIITKTPQYGRWFSRRPAREIHRHQIAPTSLTALIEVAGGKVVELRHVTCVFPKLQSGKADTCLNVLARYMPFWLMKPVSESYLVVFKKQ